MVVIAIAVVGLVLAVWFGAALARPYAAAGGDDLTTGKVSHWSLAFVAGSAIVTYSPTIDYRVDSHTYSFHSGYRVGASVTRARPVGSKVTVEYDPAHPSSAEWIPALSDVAFDFWNGVLFILGVLFLLVAVAMLILNRGSRKADNS